VLYMEFGVHRGATTRYWSKLVCNPRSKLHGFDSFEWLSENWIPTRPQRSLCSSGTSASNRRPADSILRGSFERTAPDYRFPPHDVLVLNFDAYLYTSTIFVQNALECAIVPWNIHLFRIGSITDFMSCGLSVSSLRERA
jgi:hypothetical protein